MYIAIISASIRVNNNTQRVAALINQYVQSNTVYKTKLLDLNAYQFPLFTERLSHQPQPQPNVIEFANAIKSSQGVIIVVPEYNGGYPAALKNVVDLLYSEWYHKPVAISTVSDGSFGGSQVITSLQFVLWKMKAITVPAMFPNPNVKNELNEQGQAQPDSPVYKRLSAFIAELVWCIEAVNKMK